VKKANRQGVMLICDKELSSSLPQIMKELIRFALLIDVINELMINDELMISTMISFTCEQKKSYHSPTAIKRFVKVMAYHVRFQPQNSQPQIQHDSCVLIFSRDFQMILQKYLSLCIFNHNFALLELKIAVTITCFAAPYIYCTVLMSDSESILFLFSTLNPGL